MLQVNATLPIFQSLYRVEIIELHRKFFRLDISGKLFIGIMIKRAYL